MDMNLGQFFGEYGSYLTIPGVSAIVGYGTNWLAVKMMMAPLEFKGLGPIGWQGVIPANSRKMAGVVVDHCLGQVITQQELIDRIEPEQLIEALNHRLDPFVERIVDEVMANTSNYGIAVGDLLWTVAPLDVKKGVYREVRKKIPQALLHSVEEMKASLDELMDINDVIVDKLSSNKRMLVDIFRNAAHQEFNFIRRSGFYFGLPLGISVMFLWYFFPVWWLLPVFGFLVGYITNSASMYLLQKPLEPKKIGPYVVQGLFIKRQAAVSRYFGKMFAEQLLTSEALITGMLKDKGSLERIRDLIQREAIHALDVSQGVIKPLTVMSMGPSEYEKIIRIISDRAFEELHLTDKRFFAYLDDVLDIENTIAERVGELPPSEFYELIHPVFAEDEWKLIAVGAVLGLGAGFWQWALLT